MNRVLPRFFLGLFFALFSVCSSADFLSFVEQNLPKKGDDDYVVSKVWNDQVVWIKTVDAEKASPFYCIKYKLLSSLLPWKLYGPTVACGEEFLDIEARRLKDCEVKGGNCVRLLLKGKGWIVISDGGTPLRRVLGALPLSERFVLLKKALQALLELHEKKVVQGRGDMRDVTILPTGQITFIDFAEDPLGFLSFKEACFRDLFCFFITALPHLEKDRALEEQWAAFFLASLPVNLCPLLEQAKAHLNKAQKWTTLLQRWYPKPLRKALYAVHMLENVPKTSRSSVL